MCEQHHSEHRHAHSHPPSASEFRLVLTGKGGVGKTTLTATLARLLARSNHRVLAVDADPQMNLPHALGLGARAARALTPLSQRADYVEEKTGARPGSGFGLYMRLNPDVDDVVDRFAAEGPDGVRVMVMGTVTQPATGCLCPENALLSSVTEHMSVRSGEAVLMDTQAGVEHFGRALAKGFRHAAVVTDPTYNGVQVALHAARLARELGIPKLHLVVNRVRAPSDLEKVRQYIREEGVFGFSSVHALPFDERLMECDPSISPLLEQPANPFVQGVQAFRDALVQCQSELITCAS